MTTDTLAVDIDGTIYTAERTVSGVRAIRQTLRFPDGYVEHDGETYKPGAEARMIANAKHIIWQRYGSSWRSPHR